MAKLSQVNRNAMRERMARRDKSKRQALKDVVIRFRHIGIAAAAGHFDEAEAEYQEYRKLTAFALSNLLATAQPWSLFERGVWKAHYAAMWQRLRQTQKTVQASAAPAQVSSTAPAQVSAAPANAAPESTTK